MIETHFVVALTPLIIRASLMSLAGWLLIAIARDRHPSTAVLLTRVCLVGIVICPLAILSGWSISVPVSVGGPRSESIALAGSTRLPPPVAQDPKLLRTRPAVPATVSESPGNRPLIPKSPQIARLDFARPVAVRPQNQETAVTIAHKQSEKNLTSAPTIEMGIILMWAAFLTWIVGVTILLIRICIAQLRTWSCIRSSDPSGAEFQLLADQIGRRIGVNRAVPIRISDKVSGPCTAGIFRPVVLIPASWSVGRTADQNRMVLAHELSHAHFHDAGWNMLALIVAAVGWPNLILHKIAVDHRLACEYRCDATASRIIGSAPVYRRQLARWAIEIRDNAVAKRSSRAIGLPMAQRSMMNHRLNWLRSRRHSQPPQLGRRRLVVAIAGLLLIAIATLRPVPANSPDPPDSREPAATVDGEKATADEQAIASYRVRRDSMAMSSNQTEPDFNWQEPETVVCSVTDAEGEPVTGAIVQVSSLTDQAGQSFSFLMFDSWKTNERGEIALVLPAGSSEFRVAVKAENFAHFRDEFRTAEKITVQLTSGMTVRVRAIGPDERALPDAFPMVEDSNIFGREFVKQKDGTHQSPTLNPDRRLMRVVDGSDAGRTHPVQRRDRHLRLHGDRRGWHLRRDTAARYSARRAVERRCTTPDQKWICACCCP